MILYDYKCGDCGTVSEQMGNMNDYILPCPVCNGTANRIISIGKGSVQGDSEAWIPTVLEVVDKESTQPETRAFLQEPNRKNYRNWMKANNLRPLESNEKYHKESIDPVRHAEKIMELRYNRRRIEL